MKAREYAPAGPIESTPVGRYVPPAARREALLDALDGVRLGTYDLRIVAWLTTLDDPTARTLVGLILRARAAGAGEALRSPLDADPNDFDDIAAIKREEDL